MSVSDNTRGLVLAVISSAFIGSSFILKKKGLKRAGAYGARAGVGGYAYLLEPLWWTGMLAMLLGEVANFVAYIFAPAVLVTPLGALSIIVSAVLAHFMLEERLQKMGLLGCVTCIVGSVVIVIHAPQEHFPSSLEEIWILATQPVAVICVITQLNYLNKALDTFSTAVVSPIYYVMFTTLTILASAIMFEDWSGQNVSDIASEVCGFITVISGTILLHTTREEMTSASGSISWYICGGSVDTTKYDEDDHYLFLRDPEYPSDPR